MGQNGPVLAYFGLFWLILAPYALPKWFLCVLGLPRPPLSPPGWFLCVLGLPRCVSRWFPAYWTSKSIICQIKDFRASKIPENMQKWTKSWFFLWQIMKNRFFPNFAEIPTFHKFSTFSTIFDPKWPKWPKMTQKCPKIDFPNRPGIPGFHMFTIFSVIFCPQMIHCWRWPLCSVHRGQ